MRVNQFFILAVFGALSCAANSESVYDAALNAKSCSVRAESMGKQRDCDYKIGNGFWLSIAAVGTPRATAHFMKSDFDGDYYASFLPGIYCTMISKGRRAGKFIDAADLAYVSLKNGMVYQNYVDCDTGK